METIISAFKSDMTWLHALTNTCIFASLRPVVQRVIFIKVIGQMLCLLGLEKLTNLNRSVSSVNDWLFPVELTEIAD